MSYRDRCLLIVALGCGLTPVILTMLLVAIERIHKEWKIEWLSWKGRQ